MMPSHLVLKRAQAVLFSPSDNHRMSSRWMPVFLASSCPPTGTCSQQDVSQLVQLVLICRRLQHRETPQHRLCAASSSCLAYSAMCASWATHQDISQCSSPMETKDAESHFIKELVRLFQQWLASVCVFLYNIPGVSSGLNPACKAIQNAGLGRRALFPSGHCSKP